jgi:hypothetical protein
MHPRTTGARAPWAPMVAVRDGATGLARRLRCALSSRAPAVAVGDRFCVQAWISNGGRAHLDDLSSTLRFDGGALALAAEARPPRGTLRARRRIAVRWWLVALQPGSHAVDVVFTGTERRTGVRVAQRASLLVEVGETASPRTAQS